MAYPILGEDCDLILIHPDVNDGDPYGFVLTPQGDRASGIAIQREIDDDGETLIYLFFTPMLADDLKNPDGSAHADDRSTMYAMLLDYLDQNEDISVGTVIGTFMGIGPLGHSATEMHLPLGSFVSLKLGNTGLYNPPIESDIFFGSLWQDTPAPDDALTWNTSVWR